MVPSTLDVMPINVAGKRVLILGDSLSAAANTPGGQLGARLKAAGAVSVKVNGKVSRSAVNFFAGNNGENGAMVLAAEVATSPQIVIVMLGTNDAASGVSTAADAAAFVRIRDAFAKIGAEIWAVGPPSFARADLTASSTTVYGTLAGVFGTTRVVDFRPMTVGAPRTADGVHFTAPGAATVGAKLATTLLGTGETSASAITAMPFAAPASWVPIAFASVAAVTVMAGLAMLVRRRRRAPLKGARRGRLGAPTIEVHRDSMLTPEEIADWGLTEEEAAGAPRWRVADEDEIIGVELTWKGDPTRYALAHPSTTGHRWQVTWFDKDGPMGDVRRTRLEDALNDGAEAYTYDVTAIHTRPRDAGHGRRRLGLTRRAMSS